MTKLKVENRICHTSSGSFFGPPFASAPAEATADKETRNRFSFRIKIDRTIRDRTDHEEFEERRRQKIAHFFRGCPKPLACAHFLPTDVEEFIRNIKRIRIPEDFLADSRADLPRSSCS